MLPKHAPFTAGVAGFSTTSLRQLAAERKVNNRVLVAKRVTDEQSALGVHILYIASRDPVVLTRWLKQVSERPVLTVTDSADGLQSGAVINFVTSGRVQFEVSLAAAGKAGLRRSSRLLNVALRVRKTEELLGGRTHYALWRIWRFM